MRYGHKQEEKTLLRQNARHDFIVEPAGAADPFGGKGQRYTCIRCRWAFVVKGRRVVVLDDYSQPLAGENALVRLETFADGPCPAVKV